MPASRLCQIQKTLQPPPSTPRLPARQRRRLGDRTPLPGHVPCQIAHLLIPTHLSNIIWESLTNVPNIQAGREQLHQVFTQPPTYEDYLTAIKSHKKNTAPGLTGFSYRHLKALPEDLHKATYAMLCSLWPTQHIPDY